MTQDLPAEPPAQPISPPLETPPRPARSARTLPSAPPWLPLVALAVVPALVVGLLIYLLGPGGDDGATAGIIEGLITGGDTSGTAAYQGETPPGFPSEFPIYKGAEIAAAFLLTSPQSVRYYVILSTSDAEDKIYNFYLSALDKEPWQIEVAHASADFIGMRFSRPDSPDIEGEIGIHSSSVDDRTAVYVTIDTVPTAGQPAIPDKPFTLGASRPLPANFPADVPMYKGRGASTVLVTQFGRGSGFNNFIVSFITKDSQVDVLSFYRQEFQKRGWTVTDSQAAAVTSFSLGIDFNDGARQEISGSVSADSFEEDATYTRVDLLLQVSARRGRVN